MGNDQKRAFLAIALSGIVLFGWQYFFADTSVKQQTPLMHKKEASSKENVISSKPTKKTVKISSEKKYTLTNDRNSYVIGNSFQILQAYSVTGKHNLNETLDEKAPIQVYSVTSNGTVPLLFNGKVNNLMELSGVGSGFTSVMNMVDDGRLKTVLRFNEPRKLRFIYNLNIVENPINNQKREFVYYGNGVERFDIDDDEKGEATLKWFGSDYNYHTAMFSLPESIPCTYMVKEDGQFIIETISAAQTFEFDFIFTEKEYGRLSSLGNKLELSVDYSVFGILAVPILKFMQFIYRYIPNYGIAIIIVTFFLRLLLYPLQVKSFKSMKKMQKVQPEIKAIREKYKDDPRRVQQETMAVFKRAGANPLGGCFPLLLQMPFFFAIFQVLRNSIELVGAPFFGWITDLSVKDPYYVLPVLMCLAMVVQQKVTPSPSADPTQQKMMMIMPVVFGFIMKDFPSGLCLYIFISTLLGFLQQMLVYRLSD